MKISELLHLLDGFTFSNNNMEMVTKITFFKSVKKDTAIVGAMISFDGVSLLDMKNSTATNADTIWSLKVVQLAPSHPVDTTWTPSKTRHLMTFLQVRSVDYHRFIYLRF